MTTVKSPMARPLTASLKVIVTVLVSLAVRAVSATTMLAVGRTPSITMSLLAAMELAVPGVGRVRFASMKLPPWMVSPLATSAVVPVKSRSDEMSPSCTV
ncbi:hypothetical protein D3C85_1257590 [compost metagenome]